MTDFVREVRWSNIGISVHWHHWLLRRAYIQTPWGNLNCAPSNEPVLFSERYGKSSFLNIGPARVKWVWLRGPAK